MLIFVLLNGDASCRWHVGRKHAGVEYHFLAENARQKYIKSVLRTSIGACANGVNGSEKRIVARVDVLLVGLECVRRIVFPDCDNFDIALERKTVVFQIGRRYFVVDHGSVVDFFNLFLGVVVDLGKVCQVAVEPRHADDADGAFVGFDGFENFGVCFLSVDVFPERLSSGHVFQHVFNCARTLMVENDVDFAGFIG